MTLIKFQPQRKYAFDPFFNSIFNGNINTHRGADNLQNNPAVNIIDGEDSIRLEMAAPALNKDDFQIHVEDNEMKITVSKESKKEENDERYLRREFNYMSFERIFQLPDTINTEGINATYDNGVLSLVLPKKEEAKVKPPRSIEVA